MVSPVVVSDVIESSSVETSTFGETSDWSGVIRSSTWLQLRLSDWTKRAIYPTYLDDLVVQESEFAYREIKDVWSRCKSAKRAAVHCGGHDSPCMPMSNTSPQPLLVISAQRSPLRSSRALVETVVPIRMDSTWSSESGSSLGMSLPLIWLSILRILRISGDDSDRCSAKSD